MPSLPNAEKPLASLPGTQTEAEVIATMLNTNPLTGGAATKEAVVSQASDVDILHIATHGLLDELDTGTPGALALTPTPTDPGFLTTADILKLPLTARLAVLSACDTGRGRITGDGVVGLSRSFLTAGVDSVVVSLWRVPDDATSLLMRQFYIQLRQQPNRAIALQQAMLYTRDTYVEPHTWAAFSLFGEMQ